MAKKKNAGKPKVGDVVRNKVSGKTHTVTRVSKAHGWFQIDNSRGWSQWIYFTKVKDGET